jgi:hypothetical protein
MALDLTDLMVVLVSALAGLPFMQNREWATAVVVTRHDPTPNTWMTGPEEIS